MKEIAAFFQTPVGLFVRDLIEGGVSAAIAAVIALNLDVTTPRGIALAALTGFIGGAIAVARRKLIDLNQPAPTALPPAV